MDSRGYPFGKLRFLIGSWGRWIIYITLFKPHYACEIKCLWVLFKPHYACEIKS